LEPAVAVTQGPTDNPGNEEKQPDGSSLDHSLLLVSRPSRHWNRPHLFPDGDDQPHNHRADQQGELVVHA
jgi:hypothetical protein